MSGKVIERRDVIAFTIEFELFEWLEDTAKTAASEEDFVDLYAGAVAGMTRFLWLHRQSHTTREAIVAKLTDDVRGLLEQLASHDCGGRA